MFAGWSDGALRFGASGFATRIAECSEIKCAYMPLMAKHYSIHEVMAAPSWRRGPGQMTARCAHNIGPARRLRGRLSPSDGHPPLLLCPQQPTKIAQWRTSPMDVRDTPESCHFRSASDRQRRVDTVEKGCWGWLRKL